VKAKYYGNVKNAVSLIVKLTEGTMNKDNIKKAVDAQAEDETIWFVGVSVTEAYLQQALRDLHRVIENDDLEALQRIIDRKNDV